MDENELQRKFETGRGSSLPGWAQGDTPSPGHDQAVLRAARDAARRIRRRRPGWWTRSALALSATASFALGVATVLIMDRRAPVNPIELAAGEPLMVPLGAATRDARSATPTVPAVQADPQVWYRYIQELVYAGDRVQAERHLRRFNQLHPEFHHQP